MLMLSTIRKFGLQHHDFPTMMWNVGVFLRLLALNVDSRNTKPTPVIIYVTSAIILIVYIYTYHLSTYWFLYHRGRDDLLVSILLFSLTISSSIGVVKLLYLYYNGPKLRKIVAEYLACDAALDPASRISRNVNTTLRRVKRRAIIFWLIIIMNGVIYQLIPLLRPGRHFVEDEEILIGLEPMFESPNYEIASTALFIGIFLTVYAPANITGFLIILVGYSEAQMLALAEELHLLWEDAQTHYKKLRIDENVIDYPRCSIEFPGEIENSKKKTHEINIYVNRRLVSIIRAHATNINLIKQVEGIFKNAIAMEFTLLSGGLIAELLGGLENTYIEVPFAMAQVSMDCITGQRLMDANMAFEKAVYGCNWEHFDVRNRKLVLLILRNAQKTMNLSIGGLTALSYSSLMSVFKSIYSAYTALRTTMKLG